MLSFYLSRLLQFYGPNKIHTNSKSSLNSTTKCSSLSVFSVYVFASSHHHPSPDADKLLSSGAKKHFYISQKPELSEYVIRGDVGCVYANRLAGNIISWRLKERNEEVHYGKKALKLFFICVNKRQLCCFVPSLVCTPDKIKQNTKTGRRRLPRAPEGCTPIFN